MRLVVDAMGGDRAPREVVKGALAAAGRFADAHVILTGPQAVIAAEIERHGGARENVQIIDAPEVIAMDESPTHALRAKPKSSIAVGMGLVAAHKADAFVSAGNTGAVAAAATLMLKRLEGVKRPGIAVPMKAIHSVCLGIEMGANIQCKPEHLLQYGVMASVFARQILGIPNPRVGLLNIGEEEGKGTPLVCDAWRLLKTSKLNFIGNIEGKDIFAGVCDIFVCDGFVGNVILKTSEGLLTAALGKFREMVESDPKAKEGFALCRPAYDVLAHMSDYSEYGGAPLLGTEGAVIICHGRSDAKAIENAVKEARSFVSKDVGRLMSEALAHDASAA